MCCARREDEARQTAHRYVRWAATGWPVQAELPDPKAFAAASQNFPVQVIAEKGPRQNAIWRPSANLSMPVSIT